jgi:GxxExxY protein
LFVPRTNFTWLRCERQKAQPIFYKGLEIDEGYRLDILVEDKVVLELKVVDSLNDVHFAQLLTYLKLSSLELGFLLNFNVALMKEGIRRVANNLKKP